MIGALFCASNLFDARLSVEDEDDHIFEMSNIYEDTPTITYSGDSYNTPTKFQKGSAKGSVKGSESPSRKSKTDNPNGPSRSNINVKGYVSVRTENNKRKYVDRLTGKNFTLTPDLENGAVSLAPEESIIASWQTISAKMRITDYLWSVLTLGMYYIATQWYQYRKRTYSLYVTNTRVIIKEEIFESVGVLCNTQQTHENQVSYHLSSLAYFCTEHVGSRYCGLYPPKVTLELHFMHSPTWYSRPDNTYQPKKGMLTCSYAQAYRLAYGIDLMSQAASSDRIMQIHAFTSLTSCQYILRTLLFMLILFPAVCSVNNMLYVFNGNCWSGSTVLGPYLTQPNSQSDRRRFRFEMDLLTDLDCIEHLGTVLKALTDQLSSSQPQSVAETMPARPIKSRDGLDISGGCLEPLHKELPNMHQKKKSKKDKEALVFYRDLIPLGHSESLLDGYPDHTDTSPKAEQTACYYFTSNRLIRQELWLQHGELTYARGETWFLHGNCTHNMLAVNYQNTYKHLLIACNNSVSDETNEKNAKKYSIEVMMSSLECTLRLWQMLTIMKEKRRDSLTHIPANEFDQYEEFCHARLTRRLAVDKGEWIESTLMTQPSSCCSCNNKASILTASNGGLYLEKVLSEGGHRNSNRQQRILFYRAWDTLQSSYWSNYQLSYCYGACPAPSRKWVHPYGYSGSRLMIEGSEEDRHFSFGLDIPNVYYAAENGKYNALVDTINMRCYADGELGGMKRGFVLDV